MQDLKTSVEYPITLTIDYPEKSNRLTVFFRVILAIPIVILFSILNGVAFNFGLYSAPAGSALFTALVFVILFRKKYPTWWFDWNLAFTRFAMRTIAYMFFMTDTYPSLEDEQSVHITMQRPQPQDLARGMPLVKWFLAIPHYICLAVLTILSLCCIVIAWFGVLFTGHYPRSLFNFVLGVFRWSLQVQAYAFLLITDQYPPFKGNWNH